MNKLLVPALGAAFVLGAPHIAAADPLVQLGQLMLPGQPGYTNQNRSLSPGQPGVSPANRPALGPALGSTYAPPAAPYSPTIGGPGDLNQAMPELVGPGEPDANGQIGPTVDRSRARFAGERGPDGKILPTYLPSQAQATPSMPQTPPQSEERMRSGQTPPAPSSDQMNRTMPPGQTQMNQMPSNPSNQPGMRQPGSGQMNQSGQSGTGQQMDQTGQPMQRGRTMQHQPSSSQRSQTGQTMRSGGRESNATAALNALSAEGYTNISNFERVGNAWQATANKGGRAVTVQVDPQTHQVMQR